MPQSTNKKRSINYLHRRVRDDYGLLNFEIRIGGVLDIVPHKKSPRNSGAETTVLDCMVSSSAGQMIQTCGLIACFLNFLGGTHRYKFVLSPPD